MGGGGDQHRDGGGGDQLLSGAGDQDGIGGGGDGGGERVDKERRKIVGRRGFALSNLIDGALWKEVYNSIFAHTRTQKPCQFSS